MSKIWYVASEDSRIAIADQLGVIVVVAVRLLVSMPKRNENAFVEIHGLDEGESSIGRATEQQGCVTRYVGFNLANAQVTIDSTRQSARTGATYQEALES